MGQPGREDAGREGGAEVGGNNAAMRAAGPRGQRERERQVDNIEALMGKMKCEEVK